MALESIGFYTLSDKRAATADITSPMQRCEMILTYRCNFKCEYCRGPKPGYGGDTTAEQARKTLSLWIGDGLKNIRFSGGEPMSYPYLGSLVEQAVAGGVKRIALSTNGSFPLGRYLELVDKGVNDFSISLDACCAADGDAISKSKGSWGTVVSNIKELAHYTYVTVGIVITPGSIHRTAEIVKMASDLGVNDIRLITAAQYNKNSISVLRLIDTSLKVKHPILRYRVNNILAGRNVRGLHESDNKRCPLVLDDSTVHGKYHYPCVIYLREHGNPIGVVGPDMRVERAKWSREHNTYADPICKKNCLDVCIDYNNKFESLRKRDRRFQAE